MGQAFDGMAKDKNRAGGRADAQLVAEGSRRLPLLLLLLLLILLPFFFLLLLYALVEVINT